MELLFQGDDNLPRFLHPAMCQEIAYRFGHVHADQADIKSRQGADEEGHAPAVDGDEEISDAGSSNPAEAPEAFEEHDEAAAHAGRCIFRNERRCDGQFPTKAEADEEAEDEQRLIIPGKCAEAGRNTI